MVSKGSTKECHKVEGMKWESDKSCELSSQSISSRAGSDVEGVRIHQPRLQRLEWRRAMLRRHNNLVWYQVRHLLHNKPIRHGSAAVKTIGC